MCSRTIPRNVSDVGGGDINFGRNKTIFSRILFIETSKRASDMDVAFLIMQRLINGSSHNDK